MTVLTAVAVVALAGAESPARDKRAAPYWEELSEAEKSEALAVARGMARDVVEFYNGRLRPSDDERTFALLETLVSAEPKDIRVRALYFFVFNAISMKVDGALAEMMGTYCLRLVVEKTAYVMKYFQNRRDLLGVYAMFVGSELGFYDEGVSAVPYGFPRFKTIVEHRLDGTKELEAIAAEFLAETKKYVEGAR